MCSQISSNDIALSFAYSKLLLSLFHFENVAVPKPIRRWYTQVDEYGNPIRVDEHGPRTHTDQYGNPTHHTDTSNGTGGFDSATLQGMRPGATVPTHGGDYRHDQQGLTQKIEEKTPGVGRKHDDPYQQGHTTSTTAPSYYEGQGHQENKGQHHQENKGLTEKIKETYQVLGASVGCKHDDPYQHVTQLQLQPQVTIEGQHHQENKELTEKIKENVPGVEREQGVDRENKENVPGVGRKHDDPYQQDYYKGQHHQENKGLTEKIKENVPGVGRKHDDPYQQGHTTSTKAPGYYEGQHYQENKGLTEKIKENVPGVGCSTMIRTNKITTRATSSGEQGVDRENKRDVPGVGRKHDDSCQQSHNNFNYTPGSYEGKHHQENKGLTEK
ncbi:hypothetical protein CFP56_005239 [Quercus suber]|uniref:Dehydrin n=1 Tax=Quercus suber TaxID=58331 RepID=A0AAW0L9C0_QUESU